MAVSSPTFSDQIRDVIKSSGISRYALSKRTGVTQAALCRFMQGQRGLTTDTLDRLAPELQLEVDAPYAETPAGALGKRVNYANTLASRRKQKVRK
jgi:transcriptional regulator with XRE-family HTH domain